MAKKKKGPIIKKGLDDWMATYADMVTLLFCFFVMLYSASNQEEARFQYILQAFNTQGRYVNVVVGRAPEAPMEQTGQDRNSDIPPQEPGEQDGNPPGRTNEPSAFDALYNTLADLIDEEGLQGVQIYPRPGLIRVVLEGDVVFAGNSYALNAAGRRVLDVISPSISQVQEWIRSVQVQGHTADIGIAGVGMDDWDLSSLRASTVVKYLDDVEITYIINGELIAVRGMVASEKFVVEGFAQHSPQADNDTPDGLAANRRVEIIINRIDLTEEENRFVDDITRFDYNNPMFDVDATGEILEPPGTPIESVVAGILGDLIERYGYRGSTPQGGHGGTAVGPTAGGFTTIRDTDFAQPYTPSANGENGNGDEQLTVSD
ncbi:MAG: flagellar motor protein MotB [Oscillospiraceae bacterium]|jgi:chemotaxis protein MotB|nr:flagellar motor protein MotB [Oscillospiraceae bacterium]